MDLLTAELYRQRTAQEQAKAICEDSLDKATGMTLGAFDCSSLRIAHSTDLPF